MNAFEFITFPATGSPTATLLRLHHSCPLCFDAQTPDFIRETNLHSVIVEHFEHNALPGCDGRCVQDLGTYSPQHTHLRLLAISTSCSRVTENNSDYDCFSRFAPIHILASYCSNHCNTCVAQLIRAMTT